MWPCEKQKKHFEPQAGTSSDNPDLDNSKDKVLLEAIVLAGNAEESCSNNFFVDFLGHCKRQSNK